MNAGWLEVIVGVIGVGLGAAGKMARSSVVIAVGLILMGIAHIVSATWSHFLGDIGAFLILLGLGMSIAMVIRQWRKK
ncbi:hypothetical protein [Sulfobacillus thermosulfidooxidans]|uniref:Uncharacterized protein n=1 Tax=Sulfobacillus thermosulfidooxidans (strain DSM 9293 / VKM B-1269 / AT-1) TaxID=929705 RepID=A0A1W1W7U3_SULTA|nr:hypothetical protein [Sulfobacillus thermosulfidooxidans]OLZ10533.1 hypothetical protein BFX05_01490 [Sulfobacillus thermosulfidooxidans]OLZ14211.1 hypothetical protein BFX06_07930 [Sulfobacillus thermosulfidooxidans]OLZ18954.1 hypothetical protein BFX07_04325 [Sulfobacillus thermosulfidooxidans]SMC02371.1 hypothetical protein SAMN00768000_0556 [Sulfobacillus thermosulfidooxidans DSM 9293]